MILNDNRLFQPNKTENIFYFLSLTAYVRKLGYKVVMLMLLRQRSHGHKRHLGFWRFFSVALVVQVMALNDYHDEVVDSTLNTLAYWQIAVLGVMVLNNSQWQRSGNSVVDSLSCW